MRWTSGVSQSTELESEETQLVLCIEKKKTKSNIGFLFLRFQEVMSLNTSISQKMDVDAPATETVD